MNIIDDCNVYGTRWLYYRHDSRYAHAELRAYIQMNKLDYAD